MLNELSALPEGLLKLPAQRLHERLDGPTLIHLPGRHPEPLFVSVLLHGNEDTGWEAIRALLQRHEGRQLPRALSLLIGNIAAAKEGVRLLPGQSDYNRIWCCGEGEEQQMARQVVVRMKQRHPFAAIDIHNNTGFNPHYACINVLDQRFVTLATLFSRTVVYFVRPEGVLSRAFADLCPAVTVECGKAGQAHGVEHAMEFIEGALHIDHFPKQPVSPGDYQLYHTIATVNVVAGLDFEFTREGAAVSFSADLDRFNFRELPVGTRFAVTNSEEWPLRVWDEQGAERSEEFFQLNGGELATRIPLIPSMLTLDKEIIEQDRLCYLMERMAPL